MPNYYSTTPLTIELPTHNETLSHLLKKDIPMTKATQLLNEATFTSKMPTKSNQLLNDAKQLKKVIMIKPRKDNDHGKLIELQQNLIFV